MVEALGIVPTLIPLVGQAIAPSPTTEMALSVDISGRNRTYRDTRLENISEHFAFAGAKRSLVIEIFNSHECSLRGLEAFAWRLLHNQGWLEKAKTARVKVFPRHVQSL